VARKKATNLIASFAATLEKKVSTTTALVAAWLWYVAAQLKLYLIGAQTRKKVYANNSEIKFESNWSELQHY